ncbi:hypothetical protein JCM9534A_46540 [Catenuloplanes indicus JCM 9534]
MTTFLAVQLILSSCAVSSFSDTGEDRAGETVSIANAEQGAELDSVVPGWSIRTWLSSNRNVCFAATQGSFDEASDALKANSACLGVMQGFFNDDSPALSGFPDFHSVPPSLDSRNVFLFGISRGSIENVEIAFNGRVYLASVRRLPNTADLQVGAYAVWASTEGGVSSDNIDYVAAYDDAGSEVARLNR